MDFFLFFSEARLEPSVSNIPDRCHGVEASAFGANAAEAISSPAKPLKQTTTGY